MTSRRRDSENINNAAGIAQTAYAQRTRHLITLINELRGVGAQADIDLPRIAVIGNQSAGKSSLVEAISGITVPRASGTCTRCPMECRLQNSSDPWKCQVLLRFEKDENGQRVPNVREIKFGPLLRDKSQLEEMLRRAQLAILNPSVPHTSFVDLDTSTVTPNEPIFGNNKPLQFSSNVVAFDLSGPDSADLSFIDLPGIISNVAEGEDRNNIKLVQGLVKDHIQGNSIILLTLTMRDDLENQSAAFLAKEADPDGMRTIGVLTKADTIQPGEESAWIEVLEGRRHRLKKGYYVTKQPGPSDLAKKNTFEESRRQEQEFFALTEPWKSSSQQIKSRTGIPNLTAELSKLLTHLIMKTLPKLRDDAQEAYNTTLTVLSTLPPPPPEHPAVELLRLLTLFSTETKSWIDGAEQHEGLVQIWKSASARFKGNILRTAPNFRPFNNAKEEQRLAKEAKDLAEERRSETQSEANSSVSNGRTSDDEEEEQEEEQGLASEDGGEEREVASEHESSDDSTKNDNVSPPIFLLDVRKDLGKSIGRELPYNVPFRAKRSLIEKSFTTWDRHAVNFFDIVCNATREKLNKLVDDHFGRFALSPLKDNVRSVVEKQIALLRKDTVARIKWFLELEHPPFTQNGHYFSSLREGFLSKHRGARNVQNWNYNERIIPNVLRDLGLLGFEGLSADDLKKLNKVDEFEEEIIVMAEVSAYCRVAQKRIIDDVPRIVDHDFLQALGKHIQDALVEAFGIGTKNATEKAMMYLAEDPDDVARRDELTSKEHRLEQVLNKLFNFGL